MKYKSLICSLMLCALLTSCGLKRNLEAPGTRGYDDAVAKNNPPAPTPAPTPMPTPSPTPAPSASVYPSAGNPR